MRIKHFSFFAQGVTTLGLPASTLSRGVIRFKSTFGNLMSIENDLMNSVMRSDFEKYHEAKITFDAKLYTLYQRATNLSENHFYTDAMAELKKIITLTKNIVIADLTQNQIQLLADTYTRLANILRVGSSDDEKLALQCCDKAIELNPSQTEAIDIRRSILSEYAVYPTDLQTSFGDEEQNKKASKLT